MGPSLAVDFLQDHEPSWVGMVISWQEILLSKEGHSAVTLLSLLVRALRCQIQAGCGQVMWRTKLA